jgi:hypothetical protein
VVALGKCREHRVLTGTVLHGRGRHTASLLPPEESVLISSAVPLLCATHQCPLHINHPAVAS